MHESFNALLRIKSFRETAPNIVKIGMKNIIILYHHNITLKYTSGSIHVLHTLQNRRDTDDKGFNANVA